MGTSVKATSSPIVTEPRFRSIYTKIVGTRSLRIASNFPHTFLHFNTSCLCRSYPSVTSFRDTTLCRSRYSSSPLIFYTLDDLPDPDDDARLIPHAWSRSNRHALSASTACRAHSSDPGPGCALWSRPAPVWNPPPGTGTPPARLRPQTASIHRNSYSERLVIARVFLEDAPEEDDLED